MTYSEREREFSFAKKCTVHSDGKAGELLWFWVTINNIYTLWGKKTAPLYFRNSFVEAFYSETIIGTYILQ